MKKTNLYSVYLQVVIAVSLVFAFGCEKEEDDNKFKDLNIFDISDVSSWDYMAISKDGGYLLFNESAGSPKEVFYSPVKEYNGYMILLDDYERPEKVLVNNHIFLFDNYSGTEVDIAIIYPDGSVKIMRNLEMEHDFGKLNQKNTKEITDWLTALRIVGQAAGVAACAIGLATTPAGGIGLPLVYLGCGATILGLISTASPEDTELLGMSSTTLGTVSTVATCIPPVQVDCVLGIIDTSIGWFSDGFEFIESHQDEVDLAEGVLLGGTGDIQVTLTWNSICDLDLWVTDPQGETINWGNPFSSSGGYLDYDNTFGYGPENVFWAEGMAIQGSYDIKVDYYGGIGTSTYSVLIIVGDEILNNGRPFKGQISQYQTIHIANFTYGKKFEAIGIYQIEPNLDLRLPK